MPCPKPFAQWDRRWHGIAPRPVHEGPVGMWRFDVFVLWTSQGEKSRWQKYAEMVACCVFDSRWDIVKFCPAKPGVPVWSILSLRDENFCNAGCHCQCFIFMHLLHPNPTPNSICLEPSCLTPCQPDEFTLLLDLSTSLWTIPQQENWLRQHFGTAFWNCGADGEWSWPEGAKQIKL